MRALGSLLIVLILLGATYQVLAAVSSLFTF